MVGTLGVGRWELSSAKVTKITNTILVKTTFVVFATFVHFVVQDATPARRRSFQRAPVKTGIIARR